MLDIHFVSYPALRPETQDAEAATVRNPIQPAVFAARAEKLDGAAATTGASPPPIRMYMYM